MAIDYGTKRTGIAVTDPLKIIANGLDTVATEELWSFLESYLRQEVVDCIVFGQAIRADGTPPKHQHLVDTLVKKLKKTFPHLEFATIDESYTSARASEIIFKSGAKKKKRRDKALIDKISAVLILQDYMEQL